MLLIGNEIQHQSLELPAASGQLAVLMEGM
jgi:hypothetical protein